MVRILVLGATGTIGKEVIRALLDKSIAEQQTIIRVVTRNKANAQQTLNAIAGASSASIEILEGDVDSGEAAQPFFEGVNRLFVLTHGGDNQVDITKLAIKFAGSSLEHVVKISALGANISNSRDCLMRQHADAEEGIAELLKGTKIAYTILRPNVFFQNFARDDAGGIKATGKFYRPFADRPHTKISHVDARDIGDVSAKVLSATDIQRHDGLTYNLGAKALDYYQIAETFTKVLGKKVEFVLTSDLDLFEMFKKFMPLKLAHAFVKLYQYYRAEGTTAVGYGDIEIVTGKPARTIEQYVQDYKELFV